MRVRLISSNRNMLVVGCRNEAARGKGFGSTNPCSSDVQNMNFPFGGFPATQRCETTQMKAKTNASTRHFRDGITSNIVVPGDHCRKIPIALIDPGPILDECKSLS